MDAPLPSTLVLEAVADAEAIDATDLPRLNDAVDVDALDRLFAPRHNGEHRVHGTVRFQYCGYTVIVSGDGVTLQDAETHP